VAIAWVHLFLFTNILWAFVAHVHLQDVQMLRGGRKDKKQVAKEAKEWRQKTLQENAKHKQQEQQQQQGGGNKK